MAEQQSVILKHQISDTESTQVLDKTYIESVLDSIFEPGVILDFLKQNYSKPGNDFHSLEEFFGAIRGFFLTNVSKTFTESSIGQIEGEILKQAGNLAIFEKQFNVDSSRYNRNVMPNPSAVMWPNPTHDKYPSSLFETLPYVESVDLIKKNTPIGSAGSCFAAEIAIYLKNNSYNYVVSETDPPDRPTPPATARWGVIYNTPSFTQLAEKAFGLRELPKLAEYHDAIGVWQDPFRENVPFSTLEELEQDREAHLEACRKALIECEVLCITLGLNECWEHIATGAVASRNPKSLLHYALFHHRTLTVADNIKYLQRFLDILRTHNPSLQLIVTVSPIPFLATGRASDTHVVCANEHSKAVLRVAAEEFVAANTGVHYFPSYEMVNHCIKDPWDEDQRHVNRHTVDQIMALFEKMYVYGD
jgi:hypothetical protein